MYETLDGEVRRQRAEMTQVCVAKARLIKRTLGPRCAAGYLRNRGFKLATALFVVAKSRREYSNPLV